MTLAKVETVFPLPPFSSALLSAEYTPQTQELLRKFPWENGDYLPLLGSLVQYVSSHLHSQQQRVVASEVVRSCCAQKVEAQPPDQDAFLSGWVLMDDV